MRKLLPPKPLSTQQLLMIALLVDCVEQAAAAQCKLEAMFEEIGNDQLAQASEAICGLDNQVHYVTVTMRRVVDLDNLTRPQRVM